MVRKILMPCSLDFICNCCSPLTYRSCEHREKEHFCGEFASKAHDYAVKYELSPAIRKELKAKINE